jgi:hypothetical protein
MFEEQPEGVEQLEEKQWPPEEQEQLPEKEALEQPEERQPEEQQQVLFGKHWD